MAQQNITWEAHEFKHYPKTAGWYVTLVAVFILLMAFFIIVESDYFAAVCLAIICALVIVFARQTPKRVEIELNERGIRFGTLVYPYKQLKYFWVVNNERHQTINFHTSAFINNVVILELENQDPETVRSFLLRFLPEHHLTEETTAQRIMHRFKF